MELTHEQTADGITVVRLTGALDIAGADRVGLTFNALAGNGTRMLVDLTQTSFVASMGIRLLLTVGKAVIRRGGRMLLVGPSDAVRGVLVTTGVDQLIPLRGTEAEALAELATG